MSKNLMICALALALCGCSSTTPEQREAVKKGAVAHPQCLERTKTEGLLKDENDE